MTPTLLASPDYYDVSPLFTKCWVQLCRIQLRRRRGEVLQASTVPINPLNGWTQRAVVTDAYTLQQINELSTIAANCLPTLIIGIDRSDALSLSIWQMLCRAGICWAASNNSPVWVMDEIQWPAWELALISVAGYGPESIAGFATAVPTAAELLSWMVAYAKATNNMAALRTGFYQAADIVGCKYELVPIAVDWPALVNNRIPAQNALPQQAAELGAHANYVLTADQATMLSAQTSVGREVGANQTWYGAGHTLIRDDRAALFISAPS